MEFWPFLLLGLGLVFVVLEVLIPSAGILGTVAAASIVGGGVLAFRAGNTPLAVYLGLSVLLVPVALVIALKLFPKTPVGKHMTLDGSTFDPKEAAAGGAEFDALVGTEGTAETPLRPSGKALLGGRRVDVMTRGEMIERGRAIHVLRVEGNRVIVAEPQSDANASPNQAP